MITGTSVSSTPMKPKRRSSWPKARTADSPVRRPMTISAVIKVKPKVSTSTM